MDIEWIKNAVCYADGHQWLMNDDENCIVPPRVLEFDDFQLNTIKQGDYITKSELDTEDKYNRAVEVFGLFGVEFIGGVLTEYEELNKGEAVSCIDGLLWQSITGYYQNKIKLTFNQLMAIGELKRLTNERDINHSAKPNSSVSKVNRDIERNQPKNKSKQAYAILESLDYEYDLVKQQWFRKEWVR